MELQCSVIVMYIVGDYYQSGFNYNSKLSHGLLVVRVLEADRAGRHFTFNSIMS